MIKLEAKGIFGNTIATKELNNDKNITKELRKFQERISKKYGKMVPVKAIRG